MDSVQFGYNGYVRHALIISTRTNDPSHVEGKPKPIVHRAGGMLLQSAKELIICGDFVPEDIFFYYTTTGWYEFRLCTAKEPKKRIYTFHRMMWNFLIGGLSIGLTLVLYDGSPLKDSSYLWKLTDSIGITVFGVRWACFIITSCSLRFQPHWETVPSTWSNLRSVIFWNVKADVRIFSP